VTFIALNSLHPNESTNRLLTKKNDNLGIIVDRQPYPLDFVVCKCQRCRPRLLLPGLMYIRGLILCPDFRIFVSYVRIITPAVSVTLLMVLKLRTPSVVDIVCAVHLCSLYLAADCQLVSDEGRRQLRSATPRTCVVRRTYSNCGWDRCFAAAGPKLWNSPPTKLRQAEIILLSTI